MRRLLMIIVMVALIPAFFIAWPVWSGYQIQRAIEARDAAALEHKIDFARVRVSLREPMTQRMSELYERFIPKSNALAGRMKQDLIPRLVDFSLVAVVTPENLILAAAERGRLKDFVDRTIGDEIARTGGIPGGGGPAGQSATLGKVGELTGKAVGAKGPVIRTVPTVQNAQPTGTAGTGTKGPVVRTVGANGEAVATPVVPSEPTYGLANIKQFAIQGPFRFAVGIAKDAAASEPDVTVEMSFTGTDWKVTAVRPRP